MNKFGRTKQIKVGNVAIGGGARVSVQSMCNVKTTDVEGCLAQINTLADAGCDIVRLAVPDAEAAKAFGKIKEKSPVPLVSDIHFDYRLALLSMENGADAVRINPGNIGSEDRVRIIYKKAAEFGIPVRIGVNTGSLERNLLEKYGGPTAEALCESALSSVRFAEDCGFENIIVSIKSSDVSENRAAHILFKEKCDRPMHIGLTEAGAGRAAEIKSAVAIGALLLDGIGDTVRVSLTGDPLREVLLAKEILAAAGLVKGGVDFISCPTCGRTKVDLFKVATKIEKELSPLSEKLSKRGRSIKVAVMGCAVNGPGEARAADYGVACGAGEGLLFSKGEVLYKVPEEKICEELIKLIESGEGKA